MEAHAASRVPSSHRGSEEDIWKTWLEYSRSKDPDIKKKLLLHYLPLVKHVVGRMTISVPHSISHEDLVSAGIMGLIASIDRFDPAVGVKFETYVVPRIRGAVLDELRALDWVPRSVRAKAKRLEKAIAVVENQLGRNATDEEIAQEMNMDLEELESLIAEVSFNSILSLDQEYSDGGDHSTTLYDLVENVRSEDPEKMLEAEELKQILVRIINGLPEREKLVIALYYYEELTLKEIGMVLDISESRVSQIHTKAIARIRAKLKKWL